MLFPVSEGEEIKVIGNWKRHPRYGLQFQVDHWTKVDPATLEGIEKYLGSGMIKGIGPTYAKRLVGAFGLDTLRVLSEEPCGFSTSKASAKCGRAASWKHGSPSAACRTSWFFFRAMASALPWRCASTVSMA
jgi:ATP-dependent exoDNAse (exonuclease V) alpha subunit